MVPRPGLGCAPSSHRLFFALVPGLAALLLLTGCALALKRESQCLASLTAEVVQAHEELAELETTWRVSLVRRDAAFHAVQPPPVLAGRVSYAQGTKSVLSGDKSWEAGTPESSLTEEAKLEARQSYNRLAEAKIRHQPLLAMYDKVYQRVRTRTEEESILSDVRMFMLAGPASFIFYPIIRWNLRTVLWDGEDPDAETDAVGSFCINRLQPNEKGPAGPTESERDQPGAVQKLRGPPDPPAS